MELNFNAEGAETACCVGPGNKERKLLKSIRIPFKVLIFRTKFILISSVNPHISNKG
jgi:hypothetical protein